MRSTSPCGVAGAGTGVDQAASCPNGQSEHRTHPNASATAQTTVLSACAAVRLPKGEAYRGAAFAHLLIRRHRCCRPRCRGARVRKPAKRTMMSPITRVTGQRQRQAEASRLNAGLLRTSVSCFGKWPHMGKRRRKWVERKCYKE